MNTGMSLLFNSLSDGVLILSPEGKARFANPAAKRMLGLLMGQILQQDAVGKQLTGVRAGYIELPSQFQLEVPGQESLAATLLRSPVGDDLVLLLRDVAAQHFYQSTVDNLLTLVYDGCITPTKALLDTLAQASASPDAALHQQALDLFTEVRQCLKQITGLAQLHAGEPLGAIERVMLPDLVKTALEQTRQQAAGRKVNFALSGLDHTELPPVYGSQTWLQETVTSVLEDMLARSVEGGEILIKARQYGEFATLVFSSSGRPVPAHMRDRVFMPFHGTQAGSAARPAGLGLGLALAKAVVQRYGGHVRLDEESGGITLELPTGAPRKEAEVNAAQIERYAHDISQLMARRMKTP